MWPMVPRPTFWKERREFDSYGRQRHIHSGGLNLYQKLAKIRKMTEVIQKNKRGYNYKYTSIDEILARVTAGHGQVPRVPHPKV